jgi:hypothetical protein
MDRRNRADHRLAFMSLPSTDYRFVPDDSPKYRDPLQILDTE